MRDEPARPRRPWGRSLSLPPRVASRTWHVSLSSLSSSSMMSPAFRMTDDRAGGSASRGVHAERRRRSARRPSPTSDSFDLT